MARNTPDTGTKEFHYTFTGKQTVWALVTLLGVLGSLPVVSIFNNALAINSLKVIYSNWLIK